jgi:L-2-hydroxyglutarate oxidase
MIRSFSKKLYAGSLQKLVPAIQMKHLVSNRPSGIRAQAINKDGTLVDDFLIEKQGNIVHVLNAPSPAATACLTIGEQILSKLSF